MSSYEIGGGVGVILNLNLSIVKKSVEVGVDGDFIAGDQNSLVIFQNGVVDHNYIFRPHATISHPYFDPAPEGNKKAAWIVLEKEGNGEITIKRDGVIFDVPLGGGTDVDFKLDSQGLQVYAVQIELDVWRFYGALKAV